MIRNRRVLSLGVGRIFQHIGITTTEDEGESLIAVCPLDIRLYTRIMTCYARVFYTHNVDARGYSALWELTHDSRNYTREHIDN